MSAPKGLRETIPPGALLSRDEAQAIVEKVVRMSRADLINISIGTNYTANVRFADNQMITAGSTVDAGVAIQSAFGPKHAVVTTNDLSDASLRRCVEQSEVLPRLAPDDPEGTAEAASGMGAFGTDLPSVAVITVNRALEYKNRAAIVKLTRGVCLAKATEIAVTVAYGSVEEAQKMRDTIIVLDRLPVGKAG